MKKLLLCVMLLNAVWLTAQNKKLRTNRQYVVTSSLDVKVDTTLVVQTFKRIEESSLNAGNIQTWESTLMKLPLMIGMLWK